MTVRATTRREQLRRPNGDREILPGGQDSTGLSALAAVSVEADTISGAARHAIAADVIEPAAEAVVLFDSLKGTNAFLSNSSLPAGVTRTYGNINIGIGDRRDNSGWSVARCDVDICDDPQSQAGTDRFAGDVELNATNAPAIYTFTTALDRALANAQADPSLTPWALTQAPVRVNMFPTPSAEVVGSASVFQLVGGGTLTEVASGGFAGARYWRMTATAATVTLRSIPFGCVAPGQTVTAQVRLKGTAGSVRLSLSSYPGVGVTDPTGPVVVLTGSWQQTTVTWTYPGSDQYPVQRLRLGVVATGATVGQTIDIDAAFVEDGATAGAYLDPSSSLPGHTITWSKGTEMSATLIAPTATGTYSRPVDATAPQLGLPGSKWVHRRTGALVAGARMSSPWARCAYVLSSRQGRTFTVAGWLSVTGAAGVLPSFRWVMEVIVDPGSSAGASLLTVTSDPFSVADTYSRVSALLNPVIPFGLNDAAAVRSVRVHLEVVDPGGIGAGATVSMRGAHLYAGADRGDVAGLDAVILSVPVTWAVVYDSNDPGMRVTRLDIHGNDRVSHITSAYVTVTDRDIHGAEAVGASAGRLTVRIPATPGFFNFATVNAEEVSGGPGAQLSLQTMQAWHEVDATPDVVGLSVERSTDADPSDSTVPIGNYAASSLDLELDDVSGEWSLFRREYIDLGHRIEAAVGVTYTNRCDDPLGLDTAAAGVASLTWPTGPVVPTPTDRHSQLPPAPYAGTATASTMVATPLRVTCPASEGWSMRGQVWARYTGDVAPTLTVSAVRRYETPGGGAAVVVDAGTTVPLVFMAGADVWQLVKIPTVTIPLGCNAVAVSGTIAGGGSSRALFLAAPDMERVELATGDLIEVVETAPVGVFTTTSWDAATEGASVRVAAVDRLVTSAATDLSAAIRTDTSVEAELRWIAREYLDLGSDQVVIVDQGTPIAYCIPATKVSTQIADLAKAATLTAFTDGAGRFTALLRAEVDPDRAATYLDNLNLVSGSSEVSPDQVRNDVTVKAHPVTANAGVPLGFAGNQTPTDVAVAGWVLTGQEIYLPPGNTSVEVILSWDGALEGAVGAAVGHFDWQVGVAGAFNVFSVGPGGVTPVPFPPGSNWGITYTAGQSWATADLELYPTFGRLTLTNRVENPGPGAYIPNPYAPGVWVDHVLIVGTSLETGQVVQRFARVESIEVFGSRPVTVDVRLAQSSALLPAIGGDVLDNFSLRDSTGQRWLPDLQVEVLADPWRELGDRVLIGDAGSGIAGEYRILSHELSVGVGADSRLYLRQVRTGVLFAVTDVSLADDGKVTTY